jgi:hypothetical protein
MPKKKLDGAEAPLNPEQRPTRELFRFVAYYNEKIRAHSKEECVGVLRNIQRIIDKGLGVEDLAQALENYEADEWRRANPRYSKQIRSFFTYETIKEWLKPRPKAVKPDPLARVSGFTVDAKPAPVVVAPLIDDSASPDDL